MRHVFRPAVTMGAAILLLFSFDRIVLAETAAASAAVHVKYENGKSLSYPNWYVGQAEITFEDKHIAQDGGSIGTAIGTMILSCVQGFTIDPSVAITGDIGANGKTRNIGGVSAKIKGATASKCAVVAIPEDNLD